MRKIIKDDCIGCHNNIYNNGFNNVKECWHFEGAYLLKRKEVHMDQVPPWKQKPITVPVCFYRPGFFYIDPIREY